MDEKIYTIELYSDGEEFKDFSTDKRKALAKKGEALPDGSYPIENTSDLHNAISAIGRAGSKGTSGYNRVKAHIISRAKALGAESTLPSDWGVTASGELSSRLDAIESAVLGLASVEFYSSDQERDDHGRWGGGSGVPQVSPAAKKMREKEPGKVVVHVGKPTEKKAAHVNVVDQKEPGRVVVHVGKSYAATEGGGTIHKADAAAKMYGVGSKQHEQAIKKFGPGTMGS